MSEYTMSIKDGNGLDRGKKYLEYLVKHNIM